MPCFYYRRDVLRCGKRDGDGLGSCGDFEGRGLVARVVGGTRLHASGFVCY